MKRFRFRLETLLRLRESQRDQRSRDLGEALELDARLRAEQASLETRRHAELEVLRDVAGQGIVDVDRTLELRRFLSVLRAEMQIVAAQIEALGREIDRRRQELVEADRAVRVLEKLRERHAQHYRERVDREEVSALDEIAGRRFVGGQGVCESR
jgi:flagellar export protein FliJ